jgi:hypothetical protein
MAEKADKYAKLAFVLIASDSMSNVLKNAVENANGQFSKLEMKMAKVGETSLRIGTHMRLLGQQITSTVFNVVKEAADYAGASARSAKAAGIQTTEAWQKLAYAAKSTGVDTDQLGGALNKFNKYITAAASGSKEQLQVFDSLGINIKDAAGVMRPTEEIFKDVSNIFAQVGENAAKSTFEMTLFGKSGTKLASLLNKGREGIEALEKEGVQFGHVFDGERLRELNKSLKKVNNAVQGVKFQLAEALAPAVEWIANLINKAVLSITKWISEHPKLTKVIAIVVGGLGALLMVLGTAGMVVGATIYSISQLKRALGVLGKALHLKQAFTFIKNLITIRLKTLLQAGASKVATAAQWLFNRAINAAKIVAHAAKVALLGARNIALATAQGVATAAQWLFNRAMNAAKIGAHGVKVALLVAKNIALAAAQGVATAAQWLFNGAINAAKFGGHAAKLVFLAAKYVAVSVAQGVATAAQWLLNVAMSANPIGLIIAGVIALVAGIVWMARNWERVGAFFKRLWDGIRRCFSAVWDWIVGIFLNYHPLGLLIKHWGAITTWFAGLWNNIRNVFSEGWRNITNFFTGLPARFLEFGRNILQGLINGIISMINRPAELIREMAGNIGNMFKNLLGIHSPSALFMEYGVNITRGLTGGIDTGLPAVANSTGRMAVQAVDSFGRSFQAKAERPESVYERMQRGHESSTSDSNIIPAAQIFNNMDNSSHRSGGLPVQYNQNITFSGSMSEQDKQDFSRELRQHANDVIDIMQRYFDNKERLSFS